MTVSQRDSLELSLAYTSWINDELREILRRREAAKPKPRPWATVAATTACVAVVGMFRFLVP